MASLPPRTNREARGGRQKRRKPRRDKPTTTQDKAGKKPAAQQSQLHSGQDTAKDDTHRPGGNGKSASNLSVLVRVRPLLEHEVERGDTNIIRTIESSMVVLQDPSHDEKDILRANRSREKHYAFDRVFHEAATQRSVFERTTQPLLQGVLEGYNATVFAYGPTGAGKTYTMLGSEHAPGIMLLTIQELFDMMEAEKSVHSDYDFEAEMSYVELYNEVLYDLLVDDPVELELREDGLGQSVICGAESVNIFNTGQVMDLLVAGNQRRTQEATAANAVSSRSHAILSIKVVRRSNIVGLQQQALEGRLFLCDLAGSERAANTRNVGQRMVEGQHINRSLLALGNCINRLARQGDKADKGYVNFRDSKLTRLLKDALGGNCRTVMIAHLSPASFHFEETYNTLVYANRAKQIKTQLHRNIRERRAKVAEYEDIIQQLQRQVTSLQLQLDQGHGGMGKTSEGGLNHSHSDGEDERHVINRTPIEPLPDDPRIVDTYPDQSQSERSSAAARTSTRSKRRKASRQLERRLESCFIDHVRTHHLLLEPPKAGSSSEESNSLLRTDMKHQVDNARKLHEELKRRAKARRQSQLVSFQTAVRIARLQKRVAVNSFEASLQLNRDLLQALEQMHEERAELDAQISAAEGRLASNGGHTRAMPDRQHELKMFRHRFAQLEDPHLSRHRTQMWHMFDDQEGASVQDRAGEHHEEPEVASRSVTVVDSMSDPKVDLNATVVLRRPTRPGLPSAFKKEQGKANDGSRRAGEQPISPLSPSAPSTVQAAVDKASGPKRELHIRSESRADDLPLPSTSASRTRATSVSPNVNHTSHVSDALQEAQARRAGPPVTHKAHHRHRRGAVPVTTAVFADNVSSRNDSDRVEVTEAGLTSQSQARTGQPSTKRSPNMARPGPKAGNRSALGLSIAASPYLPRRPAGSRPPRR